MSVGRQRSAVSWFPSLQRLACAVTQCLEVIVAYLALAASPTLGQQSVKRISQRTRGVSPRQYPAVNSAVLVFDVFKLSSPELEQKHRVAVEAEYLGALICVRVAWSISGAGQMKEMEKEATYPRSSLESFF